MTERPAEQPTDPVAPEVVVCLPVAPGRRLGPAWGRARAVALATVRDGQVTVWTEDEVGWDVAHDEGGPGAHHARVVRYLRAHGVRAVAAGHMGAGMEHTLGKLGVAVLLGAPDDAEAAAVAAASRVS